MFVVRIDKNAYAEYAAVFCLLEFEQHVRYVESIATSEAAFGLLISLRISFAVHCNFKITDTRRL